MIRSPIARTGTLKRPSLTRKKSISRSKTLLKSSSAKSTRGMKGRAPTAEEARFMDQISGLGCVACAKDGIANAWISLHHIDGRTKPGAHMLVLPLCAPHHQQDDTDPLQRPSVHGRKATFVARYGTELELLAECVEMIKEHA